MFRVLFLVAVATLLIPTSVEAKRIGVVHTPLQKLVRADTVVVGKVTTFEKDTVDATPVPGVKDKQAYKIAIIKIESSLLGEANTTHVKVGFIPPPPGEEETPATPPGRSIRTGFEPVYLTKDMEALFFLTKHHSGEFYIINTTLAPTDNTMIEYKDHIALAKRGGAVLTDPMKALKAEKAADRLFAAGVLMNKYKAYPEGGGEVTTAKVSAEESKLLLQALADGDWASIPNDRDAIGAYQTFSMLGLTDKDGWQYPVVKPGEDLVIKTKEAFAKWLTGPGKNYQITKWAKYPNVVTKFSPVPDKKSYPHGDLQPGW